MAAIAVQSVPNGGAVTTAAAGAGGDTVAGGFKGGGWTLPVHAIVVVGATATTISVNGTSLGAFTNQTVIIPCSAGVYGTGTTAITYTQVTSVTIGAFSTSPTP